MLRTRIALTFVVTVGLVAWSEDLSGQPNGLPRVANSPTPLVALVLNGIDDQIVIDELKLSEEQVKTLVARRSAIWDETYTSAPARFVERAAERNKETVALLKKTLTEAQYKRAVQLGVQTIFGRTGFGPGGQDVPPTFVLTRVTSAIANRYPELIEAFKFTEEQKTALTTPVPKSGFGTKGGGGGGFPSTRAIVMSSDQAKAATEFVGPVLTKQWRQKIDPRVSMALTEPQELFLLASEDVRHALKVTGEQMKDINLLREKWTQLTMDRRTELSPKDADLSAKQLTKETEKTLAEHLKSEQSIRLKQIAFQTSKGTHIEQCYGDADVTKEVGLSEKQVKELAGIWEAYKKSVAKVLETAESFVMADKQVKELTAERQAKAEAVLNTEQSTKLKEMIGEIFTGNTSSDFYGPQLPRITTTLRLFITANPSFDEALKLTPEQVKAIAAARVAYQKAIQVSPLAGPIGGPQSINAELIAMRTNAIENLQKTINDVMTPMQAKRLPQLVIQSDAAASLVNTFTALDMARTLELTPEQIVKLQALGDDAMKLQDLRVREIQNDPEQKLALRLRNAADGRMQNILTDVQKAKWKELTGEPWIGLRKTIPLRGFGGAGGGGRPLGGLGGGGNFGGPFDQ